MAMTSLKDNVKSRATGRRAHLSLGLSLNSRENVRNSNSGGPVVAMMQAAESGHRDDFTPNLRATHRYTSCGRFLRQREMRPVLVIVADVITHKAFQMAFIENNHMV